MPNILKKLNSFTAMRVKYGSYAVIASSSSGGGGAGYFAGGSTGSSSLSSTEKLTFSTEGIAASPSALTVGRYGAAGFANSGVAGYIAGGYLVNSINKMTFAADTVGTLSDTLTSARYGVSGMANSGVAGYAAGGDDGTITEINGIDKITFSADTKTTLSALMTNRGAERGGFANSGVAGYYAGGYIDVAPARIATIDKITFPADTLALLSSPTILTAAKSAINSGMANSGVAGYIHRGHDGITPVTVVEKVTFPTDAMSVVTAQLTVARYGCAGFANSGTL